MNTLLSNLLIDGYILPSCFHVVNIHSVKRKIMVIVIDVCGDIHPNLPNDNWIKHLSSLAYRLSFDGTAEHHHYRHHRFEVCWLPLLSFFYHYYRSFHNQLSSNDALKCPHTHKHWLTAHKMTQNWSFPKQSDAKHTLIFTSKWWFGTIEMTQKNDFEIGETNRKWHTHKTHYMLLDFVDLLIVMTMIYIDKRNMVKNGFCRKFSKFQQQNK